MGPRGSAARTPDAQPRSGRPPAAHDKCELSPPTLILLSRETNAGEPRRTRNTKKYNKTRTGQGPGRGQPQAAACGAAAAAAAAAAANSPPRPRRPPRQPSTVRPDPAGPGPPGVGKPQGDRCRMGPGWAAQPHAAGPAVRRVSATRVDFQSC